MRSLSVRLLLSFLVLLAAPVMLAHDVTITGTQTFASLDGSSSDHDGSANGVFTVNDGNLVVNGVVNCNDSGSANNSACAMAFNVSGNLTINNGGALYAENRTGNGTGGAITLTVGGNLAMNGNAIVSSASVAGNSAGGAITANVAGDVALAAGTTIDAGSKNGQAGAITIGASGVVSVAGNVLSGPSRSILATKLTGDILSGGGGNQVGGAITIASTTFAEPAISITSTANVVSQGEKDGAGPVTIDSCGIEIRGLVAAIARSDSAAHVFVRSGKGILVDGRDLQVGGARRGIIRVDATADGAIDHGADLFAREGVSILGPTGAGDLFAITANPGAKNNKDGSGTVRVISLETTITASGRAIEAGTDGKGTQGGTISMAAAGNVNLDGATLNAIGDYTKPKKASVGGTISVRSYSGNISWQGGSGDVRPVGSTSGVAPADQGKIILTACGSIDTTGSTFPVQGVATSVHPETHTAVCSPAAPSLPVGTAPLVTCNTPPVANDVTASTNEDNSVTITLSGTDADGDPLTFSIVSGPLHGSLGPIVPTGPTTATVNYNPNLNYNGPDSFVYQANDGNGGTDNATVSITIAPVNDAPSFLAGATVNVFEDSGAQTLTNWVTAISAGPPDESGQALTFSVSNNNNALFSVQPSISPTGTLTFTPAPNAFGSATITITLSDNGGTANGGVDTSASQTATINVNAVNDEPSFVAGGNQSVFEDAGPQTVVGWATSISAGPNESGQTLTFVVSSNNPSLFSAGPSVAPNGTLTYTPAANANGSATVSVYLMDNGGTANGGDDTSPTQTFTITVTAVNDAPSFTSGGNVSVNEDSGAYSAAWATSISAGPADESGQTLTFSVANDNNSLFSVQPSLDASGNLTFTPAANAFGSATVTVTLSDNGGTANGGIDTSAPQSFTITVNGVNDEPSFTAGGNVSVLEDSGAYSAAWASSISAGAGETQTLTFVVSNDNNALFASQPAISASGVLTFTPASNAFGTATVTVYLMDDGGTANGGDDTSPSVTFTIDITAVNDEPSFTSGGNVSVNEDSGAYSAAWATSISAGPSNESSQNVTFFVSNNNNSLFSVQPTISPAGVLSFTPAANAFGTATVSVYLQDDGGTANGGDDTSATQTFTITVNGVNDAPSFTAGGNVAVNEDSGSYSAPWATGISAGPGESGQTVAFITSNDNNGLFSVQPTISASGVLTFTPAPNAFGSATVSVYAQDNGGTANGGVDTSATVTFTITVNGVNDPPTAGNDSWETFGNTELRVDIGAGATPHVADTTTSGTGVLDNDADTVEGDPFAITGVVGCADTTAPFVCTVTGGTVTLNANGSFSFQPAPGALAGSFQYTVTDSPAAGVPASATGTVTITFHEMIWYVNGSAPAGNGTSSSPFNSFATLNGGADPDDNNDYIFVHTSAVSGNITLEQGQRLWGQGIGLTLPYNLNGNGGPTTLVPAGANPVVTATSGDTVSVPGVSAEVAGLELKSLAGNAIDVTSVFLSPASTVLIYSNNISAAGQEGIDVNAGSTSGTTVLANNNTIVSNGNGFDASGTLGTVGIGFTNANVTSTGGIGVRIDGTAPATVNIVGFNNVTVTGSTAGDGIRVNNAQFDANAGTAAFDTVNAGAVAVGSSGDAVGAAAVVMTNVSGDLAFTSLNAFGSTSGVSITGTGLFTGSAGMQVTSGGGAIRGTAGVGLAVSDASIGAANFNASRIDSNGAANGIFLNNTGTAGGLVVVGAGVAGSGGTISNTTGADGSTSGIGVYLNNTSKTSLSYMQINNHQNFAIRGTDVSNFTLANSVISGANGNNAAFDEGSVSFNNLTGTANITSSTIGGAWEDTFRVVNTSGTLNRLTMSSTTFGVNSTAAGNDGVLLRASNNATLNATVQNCTFQGAAGDNFQTAVDNNAVMDLVFTGNNVSNSHPAIVVGGGGVTLSGGGVGSNVTFTFDVSGGNTFRDANGTALLVYHAGGNGTFTGRVTGNTIGVAGIANSGSKSASGIQIESGAGGDISATVSNNSIYQYNNHGIHLLAGDTLGNPLAYQVAVTNNTVSNPGTLGGTFNGIHLNNGTTAIDNFTSCIDIRNNSILGSGAGGGTDYRLRQRQSTTVRLPGYVGANNNNAAVATFVSGNNGGATSNVANTVPTGGGYVGGAACSVP